ncbi:MAG: tRNA (N6-threonylcarbamoyladenosine(37)-N6)-methyltransferase TrmO [Gammaproteobacteria bacterium]
MIPHVFSIEPIGKVRHDVPDAEVSRRRSELVAEIELETRFAAGLAGIDAYSHLIVLFWMHRVPVAPWQPLVRPRGRNDLPLTGIFATRMRDRPNPIGLAVCELLGRDRDRLRVRRLDAYNGSPVLDIKPYDHYDLCTEIAVPDWWTRMTRHPSPTRPL